MSCTILRLQFPIHTRIFPFSPSKLHSFSSISNFHTLKPSLSFKSTLSDSKTSGAQVVEDEADVDVVEGLTMTQFCDKMIDLFINEKPRSKDWKKYLSFREEWKKYRDRFYSRCRTRADMETDPVLKRKLSSLGRKVKKIDDEIERYTDLLKEIEDNPTDINAIVAKRRRDFNGEFFRHLTFLQQTYDSLDDRDAVARLAARCLTAVSAYDNTLEIVDTFDTAQAKFDDILNSPSIDIACEKIKSFAKGKQLDSSLILLINSAWAKAKESTTMKNEVKEIMYRIYKTTKSSMRSITPKEITLLKHLLNITDPEERFSALATSFSPGGECEAKDPNGLYTTPKELHKWIKIMLDAYHLSQEETEIREAKQINEPVVIQRLFILKETIEEEYLERQVNTGAEANKSEEEF
ncbi:uncharacterized protein At4g37920, chloroplastic-like [Chenopodium quinoa]|uniref:uncharacterized protein At4g37920, chloroplastic-like n=1 Tax=Chenopodium quinoa TaxID=63459 RepID=UPI000B771125|nr:uncharacterized protein At4g37920, chloroplastic-like [Chenopodium quinoa]